MKRLPRLWDDAQRAVLAGMKRADATLNGDTRARARFAAMGPEARQGMEAVVVEQMGRGAWDKFIRTIGGEHAGE